MKKRDIPRIKNFEITNYCNLDCPVCVEKSDKQGNLQLDLLDKILLANKEIFDGTAVWLHYRGEPFMNKNIFKIIERLSEANVTARLSTNGILLNDDKIKQLVESKLNYMVISVMTNNKEEYIKFRGSDYLEKVQGNISRLVEAVDKSSSSLKLQVMGLDYGQSEEEIKQFVDYYHAMGLEVAIHKYSDRLGKSRLNPEEDKCGEEVRYPCDWCFNDMIILNDGRVTTCYFDLSTENVIGSLSDYDYSIEKLWNSKEYNELREKQEKLIFEKACKSCKDWIYYNSNVPGATRTYVKIYPLNGQPYDV